MKQRIIAALAGMVCGVAAIAAHADNADVEHALSSRPDLSNFYQALMASGVNHDLHPDRSYTIFAPVNEAFAHDSREYGCFSKPECAPQLADVIRNHIVPGDVYMDQVVRHQGGLYSIDGRFIPIGAAARNDYTIDGNDILYASSFGGLGGGMLYKIDGIIANPRELSMMGTSEYAGPPRESTSVTRHTIPDPSCGPEGCPDAVTKTTTITRTVLTPPAQPQE